MDKKLFWLSMLAGILLAVQVTESSAAVRARRRPAPHKTVPNCADDLAPLNSHVAQKIKFGGEKQFNLELSLSDSYYGYNGSPLNETFQGANGRFTHGRGVALYSGGLRLNAGNGEIEVTRKDGTVVLRVPAIEPIAQMYFVSDKKLKNDEKSFDNMDEYKTGFLSVVGWTTTRYYRVEMATAREIPASEAPDTESLRPSRVYAGFGEHGEDKKYGFAMSPAGAGGMVIHYYGSDSEIFEAAGLEFDPKRFFDDEYYQGLKKKFNSLAYRSADNLPFAHEEGINFDALRMGHRYGKQREPSLVREALGELAKALVEATKNDCAEGIKNISSPGYPDLLLRLASKALLADGGLRNQFASLINAHKDAGLELIPLNGDDENRGDLTAAFRFRGKGLCKEGTIVLSNNFSKKQVAGIIPVKP